MKLGDLYKQIVDFGMKKDPRGIESVKKELKRANKEYEALDKKAKAYYDKERLVHPYADTRILFGEKNLNVKTVMVGVDVEVGEVVLADRLNQKGKKIDLLIGHHPEGTALAGFYNVMYMQIGILNKLGVPINIAESLMKDRIKEVERRVLPANHSRAVDAAKLLNIPFMTCHTPADNCVATYLQGLMDKKKPDTLGDIIDILIGIPEYKDAAANNAPPKIIRGSSSSNSGKIFVDMTGGTEGSKDIFNKLSQAGVSTMVCMHLSEEHFKKAQAEHMNVIVAGHIASDNIGINLVIDEIEKKERLNVINCSGFRRYGKNTRTHTK
ncbi:MAG: NGG1p interacting factor NIF3 [Candidatus Omnitrophota bacterium]